MPKETEGRVAASRGEAAGLSRSDAGRLRGRGRRLSAGQSADYRRGRRRRALDSQLTSTTDPNVVFFMNDKIYTFAEEKEILLGHLGIEKLITVI